MYVGTIHSFCLRLLKELSPEYRNFEVMDEVRQAALISANFVHWEDSDRGIGLDRLRSETLTISEARSLEIAERFEEHGGERAPFLFKSLGARDLARPMSQLLTEPWLRAGPPPIRIDDS